MVVVDACHADTTVDEFVYFSRRTETKVSVPIRASTVLLVLCAQSLCIDAWVKPRYNQPWSPAAPSRAADFESRLASATALLQSDWQPTLNVQTVPYIYTSGSSNADVKLNYVADALGNNIPDFSHAGFEGGGVALPTDGGSAPIIHLAPSGNGTDAANLIATIASVLSLPTNAAGWKAVIQLAAGTYDLRTANGAVQLADRMGYIVRGAGSGQGGTTLLCNDTCFFLNGRQVTLSNATDITRHVTTGSYRIYLANTAIFAVNDHVHVNMSVTAEWASDMQYNGTGTWHAVLRTVTAVSAQYIDLDVPLYYPIYQGTVSQASAVYVHHVGFAHLRAIRPSGTPNLGVVFDAHGLVQDVFVKDVVSEYFGTLLQGAGLHSRRWTFEDCVALFNPIASIEPDIRQTFRLYHLSQLFIHRVSAQYSRDFLTSNNVLTASCVVISHCTDIRPWRPMYYAFGAMYPGQLLEATYSEMGTDWSWNAALSGYYAVSSVQWNNYVAYEDGSPGLYKCAGPTLIGQNVCVGNSKDNSSYWNDVRNQRPVLPTSLYMQQLRDRLGCAAVDGVFWPAQISGTFQYPTANSTSTWLISNMNQYDTNKTDWITGNATLFYRGDPHALQYSACSSGIDGGSEGPVSVDSSAGNTSSATLTDGALAGTVIGSVLGAAVVVSAVLLIVYRHRVRAKCAS